MTVAGGERQLPMSGLQRGLLLHAVGAADPAAYVQQARWRVTGPCDVDVVRARFAVLVARHAALRTGFRRSAGGDLVQVIVDAVGDVAVPLFDWRQEPRSDRIPRYRDLVAGQRRDGFDLAAPPLARPVVVRFEDDVWDLILTFHHIILDGVSVELLRAALLSDAPTAAEDGPDRYADFLRWCDSQDDPGRHRAHWEATLATVCRHDSGTAAGWRVGAETGLAGAHEQYRFRVDRPLAAAVEATRTELGTTAANLYLGAWLLTCARASGSAAVTCGVTESLRHHAGRELGADLSREIGLLTNTLPVGAVVAPTGSARDVIAAVHRQRAGYLGERITTPLWRIGAWLRPELQDRPLLRYLFSFQELPAVPPVTGPDGVVGNSDLLADGREAWFEPTSAGVHYDLALAVVPGARPELVLAYRPGGYDPAAVERIAADYLRVLAAIGADPDVRADEIELSAAEYDLVVRDFNATTLDVAEATLPELVAAQAATTPDAVAVSCGDDRLSYRDLDRRANQLAHHLRARGVGPEVVVGVCLPRGIDLPVVLLGIMRAGGAYLPLDPEEPPERAPYLLTDGAAAFLVTDVPRGFGHPEYLLPAEAAAVAAQPARPLPPLARPEHPIYVVYTSGSTGRPKGVVVPHGAVANLAAALRAAHGGGVGQRVLQLAPVRFDASVFDFSLALTTGATLVLPPPGRAGVGSDLLRTLRVGEVTCAAILSAALRSLPREPLPALRTLISGGETIPVDVVNHWAAGRRFVSAYGPTEATVVCTSMDVVAPVATYPPIGRPIGNSTMYVLDGRMRPVPVGVTGELYIGGAGIARGYAEQPAATAERFVPDPFSGRAGARLYRTGDLGRWTADGTVVFCGRVDDQVKIRGYRVECDEVTAVLRDHPAVREAAVVARADGQDQRLVAYVVPAADDVVIRDLRADLARWLPDYMVPSAFVTLAALPTTASGKLDRAALPAPKPERSDGAHRRPGNHTAELLAGIWAEVLGVEAVGATDDFFALGGHSLLAARAATRIGEALGQDVPVAALFAHPTVEALATVIDGARAPDQNRPPLRRRGDTGPAPLSAGQRQLWFMAELVPGNPLYNTGFAVRLRGDCDAARLRRALADVVDRHAVLRSSFPSVDGQPRQVVAPVSDVVLPVVDVADADAARAAARQWGRRVFDLAAGPLCRFVLFRIAPGDQVLLVSLHHIVTDGLSMRLLAAEVAQRYDGAHDLPELPVQYADFAVWQQSWSGTDVTARQLDWWVDQLTGAPPVLDLPTDHPRPPKPRFAGGTVDVTLPPELMAAVARVARAESATMFMTLLAVYAVLLVRTGGHPDVVVGIPTAGRPHRALDTVIGPFANLLPARIDCRDATGGTDVSFRELLARVRQVTIAAMDHADVPFERLVERLAPTRDLSRHPLVQTLFQVVHAGATLDLPGMVVEDFAVDLVTTRLDLELHVVDHGDGRWHAQFVYASELFDAATMTRFADSYLRLLATVAADPGVPLPQLETLTVAERDALAGGAVTVPAALVPELAARQTGGGLAVVCGDVAVSYDDLAERVERLAAALVAAGVTAGAVVGVGTSRGVGAVVALLAVWRAGGVCAPLDRADPVERWEHVATTTAMAVLVTEPGPVRLPVPAVVVDAGGVPVGDVTEAAVPAAVLSPDDAAYIITTSGSTGLPKLVCVTHGSLAAITAYSRRAWEVGPGVRVGQALSLAFDVAMLDVAVAVSSHATLHIAPQDRSYGTGLEDFLRTARIDVMQTVPALWTGLRPECGAALRHLAIGGEAMPVETLRRWGDRIGTVHHVYGTTEAGVYATEQTYTPATIPDTPTVGRPVANMTAYLLDDRMAPVPVGAVGELHLGGAGLAWGYVGQPGLTAERFLPDPFAERPGGRLYRSGDLGRWTADGRLEFAGRADHQVKIRGYRVECGEIESRLREHPAIREAAVVPRGAGADRHLAAYVAGDGVPAADTLRDWLRPKLPAYLLPQRFVRLPALPKTTSGKVDRTALPEPAPESGGDGEPPRSEAATPTEELVAGIWAEVLGLDEVGRHDNFFALGGHSLLAVQVMARVRDVFGLDVELSTLFEGPTLTEVARLIDDAVSTRPRLPALTRTFPDDLAGRDDLPLSFGQERLWFTNRLVPDNPFYNTASAVRFDGALDLLRLRRALTAAVARHAVLRAAFPVVHGEVRQVVAAAAEVELPVVEVADADAARDAVQRWGRRVFDLTAGPLYRFAVFRIGPRDHVLLVVLHHIVADGWSVRVFTGELGRYYRADDAAALPELPVQYADFASWQRQWLTGELLARELDWWSDRLRGMPPTLRLPIDRPRPRSMSFQGHRLAVALPSKLMAEVAAVARATPATMFMLLLAAYVAVLSRTGAGDDVVVGSAGAGRSHRELEGLVGFFVNTLVMRVDCAGDPSFEELLERVRRVTIDVYDHQDVPFERLVERLAPARDLSRNPLVQTLFQVSQFPAGDTGPRLPGLRSEAFPLDLVTTRVDLELHVVDHGDGRWSAEFVYATDLFDRATVQGLADAYRRLLDLVADDPELPLSALVTALPAAGPAAVSDDGASWDAPRDDVERRIAAIWAEVVGLPRIGIFDNFFDRGGTELAAVAAAAQMTEALRAGVPVPVAMIFAHPTVAECGAALRRHDPARHGRTGQ
ncbi:amino acid adenylation domain-containing protein [Actinomycetes bacterium KLBMP 9797]